MRGEASLTEKIKRMDWQTISELAMAVTEDHDRLWELLADELKERLDRDRQKADDFDSRVADGWIA